MGAAWAAANPAAAMALVSANPRCEPPWPVAERGVNCGLDERRRPATVDSQHGARRASRRSQKLQPPRPSDSARLFSAGVPLSPASRASSRALQHVESGRELLQQALYS